MFKLTFWMWAGLSEVLSPRGDSYEIEVWV